MSLSWGRQPPPTPERPRIPVPAIAIAAVLLVAGGVGFAIVSRPGPSVEETARPAIADLQRQRVDALLTRDLDAYMRTVDPARVFLRDCEGQRFQAATRGGYLLQGTNIGKIEKWGDYLRVWVEASDGWERIFVRNEGSRWYVSEPTANELGEDMTREFEGVKVRYRAVETDFVAPVGEELTSIVKIVSEHAAAPPRTLFSVRIATLTSTSGRCFIAGQAEGYGLTVLTMKAIALTPGLNHITRGTSAVLEHEALHWLQFDRLATSSAVAWWLMEGWPYLIANTPSLADRARVACARPPRLEDLGSGPTREALPEDVERMYIAASLLVERIGGDATYWKVMDAYGVSEIRDPLLATTGTSAPSLYAAWLADTRAKYC